MYCGNSKITLRKSFFSRELLSSR